MTISQARTGGGARTDAFATRLSAIKAPTITAQDVAAAWRVLSRQQDGERLADMLGLEERGGANG